MTETSKPLPASGLLNEVNDEFSGLTLALSKGRILEETMPLLRAKTPKPLASLLFRHQTRMYAY